jgi:hypothetical protein
LRRQSACATLGSGSPLGFAINTPMKPLLAAAVLALAAPGVSAAAGLSLASHDLRGGRPHAVARFDLVGLHWRGPGTVLFRTRSLKGRWSAWHRAAPGEDDRPDRGTEGAGGWRLGAPYWTGGADRVQYRTVGRVVRVRAFFVRSGRTTPRTIRRPDVAGMPPIITRAEWGANEAIRRGPPRYADGVHLAIVHHTAGSNAYTAGQSAAIVRAIELYHVQGNGWNDIGYNFLVDKYGQIFEGRYGGMTRAVIGAHAMGFNTGSVGVSLVGNYSSATVTPAARAALVSLLAWRLDLAHVDPLSRVVRVSAGNPRYPPGRAVTLNAISAHRDTYPTSCPGNNLYAQLGAIRRAVAQTGLPKIYEPAVSGALGGPVRFTARLSSAAQWTVTVRDQTGATVASGTGTGTRVDWTWDASAAALDQQYTWSIAAPGARSATGAIGVGLPPPALAQVKITPAVVLPRGGPLNDRATLSYRLNTQAIVTASVLDQSGAVVAELFRRLRPAGTQRFLWRDVVVPDGHYRISVVARNALGQEAQALVPVTIDRTLGTFSASAAAFSPAAGRQLAFGFQLYGPASVQLRIFSGATAVATLLDAELNAGAQRVAWDGGGLADGVYSAVLDASDSLVTVRRSLPITLDRVPPVLRLLSARLLRFRLSEPARVTLVLDGRTHRLTVRRVGVFRVGHRGTVHSLVAFAVDAAGNRSRTIRVRR